MRAMIQFDQAFDISAGDERLAAFVLAFAIAFLLFRLYKRLKEVLKLKREQREAAEVIRFHFPEVERQFFERIIVEREKARCRRSIKPHHNSKAILQ